MKPIEIDTLLEAAKRICDLEAEINSHTPNAFAQERPTEILHEELDEYGPAIAAAFLKEHQELYKAEEFMAIMLEVLESVDRSETSLSDKEMMREARKFLERARRA